LPRVPPHVYPEDTELLADTLSHSFHQKEGRCRHCQVNVYRKGKKERFFAHLSDFGQADPEWEGNNLYPRARLPSFEIIFVYTRSEGSLDIHAPGNTKYVEDLQQILAESILRLGELDEFTKDNQVYRLDRLGSREFELKNPEGSGIQSAVIKRLRLSLVGGGKRKVAVEAEPKHNPQAVYALIDGLNLPPFHVRLYPVKIGATPCEHRARRQFWISRGWLHWDLQQAQHLFLLCGRCAVLIKLSTVYSDSVAGYLSQAINHAAKRPTPRLSLSIICKQGG